MKAIKIFNSGGPEILTLTNLPLPEFRADEVLIEQHFAALNFGDVIRRKRGLFSKEKGYIPGFEGMGIVADIGKNVTTVKKGDRVIYLDSNGGGYSELVATNKKNVMPIGDEVDGQMAAAIMCVGNTAWHLFRKTEINKGDTALVYGAAGGVGLILSQILLNAGVNVVAIVSSKEKENKVKEIGVQKIVNRTLSKNLAKDILVLNGGNKIHVVYDCVGQALLDTSINVLKKGGHWFYYGSASGHAEFPGLSILMSSLTIQGFVVFDIMNDQELWFRELRRLLHEFSSGQIQMHIDSIFPLSHADQAHKRIESGAVIGKILLDCKSL